jgi:hypothetical protein
MVLCGSCMDWMGFDNVMDLTWICWVVYGLVLGLLWIYLILLGIGAGFKRFVSVVTKCYCVLTERTWLQRTGSHRLLMQVVGTATPLDS